MRKFGTPNLILLSALSLASCAGSGATAPVTAQTVAQQIQSHWGPFTSAVALALLDDNASVAKVQAAQALELTLKAQVDACAASADTTCLSTVKPAIVAFVSSLALGTKGQLELQIAEGLLPAQLQL